MSKPSISVIIPTYNAEKTLDQCLYSIFNQDFDNMEVIIVDNNSCDNTQKIANRYNCSFLRVSSTKAQARKIGFYHSLGEYLLIVDSDMTMETGLFSNLVDSISNGNFDALTIDEEFPSKSIFHVAKNIEKECYRGRVDVQSPRFYRREILEIINWDNLDDGWDEYEIFLESQIPESRIGMCKRKIYLMEKPVNLPKKFHHGKNLKQYKKKYGAYKVVGDQFNFEYRLKLLKGIFKTSSVYGLLVLSIKLLETLSFHMGTAWSSLNDKTLPKEPV